MMGLLREQALRIHGKAATHVTRDDFDNPEFRRDYSNYLLGEVKDQLQFYYSSDDFKAFLRFFEYLEGRPRFTKAEFEQAYRRFRDNDLRKLAAIPQFLSSDEVLLQFLYELGVINYKEVQESAVIHRWCFRERTYANLFPKIRYDATEYEFHYGLYKALNMGTKHRPVATARTRRIAKNGKRAKR